MASLRVYCLLLLMHLLHVLDICEMLPILYFVTCDCCAYERTCVHEAVLKFLTKYTDYPPPPPSPALSIRGGRYW